MASFDSAVDYPPLPHVQEYEILMDLSFSYLQVSESNSIPRGQLLPSGLLMLMLKVSSVDAASAMLSAKFKGAL